MQLRWTEQAADDLEAITDYLFANAPEHAERIVRTLYNTPPLLLEFPHRGRPGYPPKRLFGMTSESTIRPAAVRPRQVEAKCTIDL
jgi:plasmid stabilization system protein ParE